MSGRYFAIFPLVLVFSSIIVSIMDSPNLNSNDIYYALLILLIIFIVLFLIIALTLFILKKMNSPLYEKVLGFFFEIEDDFDGEKYVEELRNKIMHASILVKNKKEEKSTDILELMLDNMKEIRDYYVISKQQATKAFSLAVSLCIFGFLLMATSIVLSVGFELSLSISLIPAIGGAIAEIIAGTALIVYKFSLSQLNNYYKSLHNNERFLSLVNLVSKVSPEKQDEAYLNIINVELQNYRK